jgi:hypothetical protein
LSILRFGWCCIDGLSWQRLPDIAQNQMPGNLTYQDLTV